MPRVFRDKNAKATIQLRNGTKKKNVANRKYVANLATKLLRIYSWQGLATKLSLNNRGYAIRSKHSYVLLRFNRGYRDLLLIYISRIEKNK